MALEERSEDGDVLKFLIKSNDPARDELKIVCQAEDETSKREWLRITTALLYQGVMKDEAIVAERAVREE